jgi:uncharacterized membrane protein YdcZ (DUF606 family)
MLAPEHFGDLLDELIDQPEFWMVIGQVVFGLHLTVYFSVLVSRGALGLAIAALILGNLLFRMLIVAFGSTHVSDATLSELVLLALVPACVALQFGIGRRVRRLAAEE